MVGSPSYHKMALKSPYITTELISTFYQKSEHIFSKHNFDLCMENHQQQIKAHVN